MARLNKDKYKGRTVNMRIDPFFKGDIFEEYPFLEGIPQEDVGELRIQDYIRSLAFILDPNSPIVREYTDLIERRDLVYEMMVYGGNKNVKIDVWLLVFVYRNNMWTQICANQFRFHDLSEIAFEPIDKTADDDKKFKSATLSRKVLEDMLFISQNNDEMIEKMFMGDENMKGVAQNVYMTPEKFARKNKKDA